MYNVYNRQKRGENMSVQISMRVSKEQKERLVELSKKQNKSLTQYVLDRCIIDDVARSSARVKKCYKVKLSNCAMILSVNVLN